MTKRNKVSLVRAVCRNCGTRTVGRWCHACGQDLFAGTNHRLREIVGNSLGTVFALDNKVFRTLWYLVAYPGRLTNEFYAGRIVRYVFPSKLFWFIAVIFFALLLGISKIDPGDIAESATDATSPATEQVSSGINLNLPEGDIGDSLEGALATSAGRRKFMDWFTSALPYMTLLLMPVFALLVWLFFKRRDRSYSDYLVFSLHFNSFVFLLLSIWLVVSKIFPDLGREEWFFLWMPAIYLGFALRRVYRPRIVPMILKIGLLGLIYVIILLSILILSFIILAAFINKFYTFA